MHKQMAIQQGNEMQETKKVRVLLLLMFLSCCLSAFCLGTLAYTMATGQMPFDINIPEQFKSDMPQPQPKFKAAPLPIEERTPDELTLRELDEEMKEKLMSLDKREMSLKESTEALNQLISNAGDIKKKTEETLEAIKKERKEKVDEVKAEMAKLEMAQKKLEDSQKTLDASIVRKIAGTLSQMRPTTSMILLADLDIKEAARLLNEMTADSRSGILASMIEVTEVDGKKLTTTDKLAFRKKANEIIVELRQLKENPGGKQP